MAQKTDIPKKFRDKKFTFVDTVADQLKKEKNVSLFPKDVKFVRQEKDEEIILVTRKHWIAYAPHLVMALFVLIIPLFLLLITSGTNAHFGKPTIYLGLFVASIVVSVNILVTVLIQWYYNVSIITDKRILSLTVHSIFHHSYTEILWTKIQDVSHDSIGFLSSIFDIGNIYLDTAGAGVDLILRYVPKPRDVQDVIDNLVDLAHKGKL